MRTTTHSYACFSGRPSDGSLPRCTSCPRSITHTRFTHFSNISVSGPEARGGVGRLARAQRLNVHHFCLDATESRRSCVVQSSISSGNLSNTEEGGSVYPLERTQTLVETAMLAAVSGLAFLLSTILKLEGSLGYFLPLPIVLAAMRRGPAAGWKTMMASGFLLVVLLGPLRAVSYLLIHGLLAASLASLWCIKANFWLCVGLGAAVRMAGQLLYLVLSSVTMNENLFAIMMSNVYAMLDQVSANIGFYGSPSPLTICCVLFALLSINASCYVFLLQVVYRVLLQSMGYSMGPLPGIIKKYLYAGMPDPEDAKQA